MQFLDSTFIVRGTKIRIEMEFYRYLRTLIVYETCALDRETEESFDIRSGDRN